MSDFYVGQKVVCVDDSPGVSACWCGPNIKCGAVYTIFKLFVARDGTRKLDNQVVCQLTELHNGHLHYWGVWRFAPLEENPDAIEWARQICRDVEAGKTNRQKIVAGLREAVQFAKRGVA
jgi:hypothetical protein